MSNYFKTSSESSVAILYQAQKPSVKDGIIKPMKEGGYADSGADIAYALLKRGITLITPVTNPDPGKDQDWVFADTETGIREAVSKGATVLWLNTVLYSGHPIEKFIDHHLFVVGQIPENVEKYDDKIVTNHLLKVNGLPVPESVIITAENLNKVLLPFSFPVVAKPIRGRGSQGVQMINNWEALHSTMDSLFEGGQYGKALYIEEFLSGKEVTITVMPPGTYMIKDKETHCPNYWCLPAVKRFNHQLGIAPYNGTVAVIYNSQVLSEEELQTEKIQTLSIQCGKAAALVGAKAPIRIDCRADENNEYFLFDLNMKPNMTGPSRSHRQDQDSLTTLAARAIGWDFSDLLINMLNQKWRW